MMKLILPALTILLSFGLPAGAAELRSEAMPRKVWAPTWPDGPLKVLFLASYAALHNAHELQQRFDIEPIPVATTAYLSHGKLGYTGNYWPTLLKDADTALDDIREGLSRDWQVLVLREPGWGGLPDDIEASILKAVTSGRTLVMEVHDTTKKDFAAAGAALEQIPLPTDRFALEQDDDPPKLYRCGDGHVLHWVVKGSGSFVLISPVPGQGDFEYLAGRAGWYLRQAGRPGTRASLASLDLGEGRVTVVTTDEARIRGGRLDVAVRRRESFEKPQTFSEYAFEAQKTARPGATVTVDLPQLPGGNYQVEVTLVDRDGRTLDWNAIRFEHRGVVKLKAVDVGPVTAAAGDRLSCTLDVEGPTEGLGMTVRWFDQWGRLLFEKRFETFSDRFDLVAPLRSLSVLNHIQVTLGSKRGPETVAVGEVLMPQNVRPTDDFHVLYWKTGGEGHGFIQSEALRRQGMADAYTNCAKGAETARVYALNHIRTIPYTTSFHRWGMDNLIVNEQELEKIEQVARKTARDQKPYGILAHTLGDENYMSGWKPEARYMDHPKVWEKFRAFLRTLYPDIAALNAQWDTAFADWDAIHFESEKQMLPSLDNPSAWVDLRFFIEAEYAAVHHRMRDAIRQEHPGVIVGFDGAEQYSSYDGYDWWLMARDMDMINVYHNYLIPGKYSKKIFNGEAAASIGTEAVMKGCWLNNTDLRYGGHFATWYLLLNGWNSVWWWNATFLQPANGALQWNMQPTTIVQPMASAAREIKRGPATLLAHARKQVDPIAIHYSSANWHGSTMECGNGMHINNLGLNQDFWMAPSLMKDKGQKELWGQITPKGHYAAASKSFYMLLHDMGFEPRTMARQEIEAGELQKAKIKVLVLPFVVSMSDAEAKQIRAFAEAGGMVVADYRCGLRDEHGKVRPTGALDDVFGIKRVNLDVTRKRQTVVFNRTDTGMGGKLQSVFHESIVGDEAGSWGYHDDGAAALFVNFREGGIKAIYLNFDLYAYEQMRREGVEHDVRKTLRYVLMSAWGSTGSFIKAPFVPESKHGDPLAATQVTRFRDGNTWYFGVLPDFYIFDKSQVQAALPFPRGTHVYDVRGQRYLGPGGVIRDDLERGRPAMYAALPYKVAGLSVACPPGANRGEPIEVAIQVVGDAGRSGPHAVRVQVVHPDGFVPEYWPRTIYLPEGRGTFAFTPALNAPAGTWLVRATDAVSGMAGADRVRVR